MEIDVALPSCTGTPRLIREQHRIQSSWQSTVCGPLSLQLQWQHHQTGQSSGREPVQTCYSSHDAHYLKICSTFLHPNWVNISMRKYCITLWFSIMWGNFVPTAAHHVHLSFGAGEHRDRHRHDNTDSQRQIRPIYDCKLQSSLPPVISHQCGVKTGPEHPQEQHSCEEERKGGYSCA